MTTAKKDHVPFEAISADEYIDLMEVARYFHEKGMHTDKSVVYLAELIYNKQQEINNEN